MSFEIGDIVRVSGVSGKGKNRTREHGVDWVVKDAVGSDLLLSSVQTGYLRWHGANWPLDFLISGLTSNFENCGE